MNLPASLWAAAVCIYTVCMLVIVNTEGYILARTRGYEDPLPLSRAREGWVPTAGGGKLYSLLLGGVQLRLPQVLDVSRRASDAHRHPPLTHSKICSSNSSNRNSNSSSSSSNSRTDCHSERNTGNRVGNSSGMDEVGVVGGSNSFGNRFMNSLLSPGRFSSGNSVSVSPSTGATGATGVAGVAGVLSTPRSLGTGSTASIGGGNTATATVTVTSSQSGGTPPVVVTEATISPYAFLTRQEDRSSSTSSSSRKVSGITGTVDSLHSHFSSNTSAGFYGSGVATVGAAPSSSGAACVSSTATSIGEIELQEV
eukprot:CAMPEP_0175003424 /NCGR_PEP_ID=MMETSP0005-20121125/4219_1 /TAXON_ID=420556 /ORGANISM="Ochromonas sp., Strain CCMP1393" /LENGTH=310 /DNA_ID=CAMNT_0016258495 /DNA_START=983 /DNA_END=1915 /DNA_ORIENTATION=+